MKLHHSCDKPSYCGRAFGLVATPEDGGCRRGSNPRPAPEVVCVCVVCVSLSMARVRDYLAVSSVLSPVNISVQKYLC